MPTTNVESLGPAERIIQALLTHQDHAVHNRPGYVMPDARFVAGVRWEPCTTKDEGGVKVVYKLVRQGKKSLRVRLGTLRADGKIMNGTAEPIAEFREPGLFPETVAWMYRQVADVWRMDNEFAAHWASYQFPLEHSDLKVVLCAFMLCQSRKGDPIRIPNNGIDSLGVMFRDEDFRDVGEAMCLLFRRDGKDFNAKMLLRVYDVLMLPQVAAINRELGFGRSTRHPFLGRWPVAVEKWLRHREQNPKLLHGLMKAGWRNTVMDLAERVHYKPETPWFFEMLRWPQKQYRDGRRGIAIGVAVKAAESWAGLDEAAICERITQEKPKWKRLVSYLPATGLTKAMMMAAIEADSISDREIIILTPTLEELGLLPGVPEVKARWERATKLVEDMRAANIARNVRSTEVKEKLEAAADGALQRAVEKVIPGLDIYAYVDVSGSMNRSIAKAIEICTKLLQGFPAARLHVCIFNTMGREIVIRQASAAGVMAAFMGIKADGGTDYGAGIRALAKYQPAPGNDALMLFIGDEGDQAGEFSAAIRASGIKPVALALVFLESQDSHYRAVTKTAAALRIPLLKVDVETFSDPYNVPRTVAALLASAPVAVVPDRAPVRKTLVEQILACPLLSKPAWA
jgi:hypothetical protein